MFWCPAEGTLSFDADDVGSRDPVPNLSDPQNHVAFEPRPAMHRKTLGMMNRFKQHMLDMFLRRNTVTWSYPIQNIIFLMDQPGRKGYHTFSRNWLPSKSKIIETIVPWSLELWFIHSYKNNGLFQKTFYLMIFGPPAITQNGIQALRSSLFSSRREGREPVPQSPQRPGRILR